MIKRRLTTVNTCDKKLSVIVDWNIEEWYFVIYFFFLREPNVRISGVYVIEK